MDLPLTRDLKSVGTFSAVTRTRFADQAYAMLLHKIIIGEFHEGEMLPSENDLCRNFGISRPVVRETLQRLRVEGLIMSRQGVGSFVQPRPPVEASSAFVAEKTRLLLDDLEFRTAIEPQAARLAARRRTAQDLDAIQAAVDNYEQVAVINGAVGEHLDFSFHLAVATATQNRRFVEAVRMVEYDIDHGVNLMRYLVRFDPLERSRSVHADHAQVLAAIRRKQPEAAAAAMSAHLERARARMLQSRPEPAARQPAGRMPKLARSGR